MVNTIYICSNDVLDVPGAATTLSHRGQSLLTKDQQKNNSGRQEQIQEERLAVQSLINFDDVDGLVEDGFSEHVTVLK